MCDIIYSLYFPRVALQLIFLLLLSFLVLCKYRFTFNEFFQSLLQSWASLLRGAVGQQIEARVEGAARHTVRRQSERVEPQKVELSSADALRTLRRCSRL